MFFLWVLLVSLGLGDSYKILIYNPRFSHSHVSYAGKIADVLVQAGHDVVVFAPLLSPNVKTNGTKLARVVSCPAGPGVPELFAGDEHISSCWLESGFDNPLEQYLYALRFIADAQAKQCKFTLQQDSILNELKAENFDLGISEIFDTCGLGIFEAIGIRAHIVTSATVMYEGISQNLGLDMHPNYIPSSISTQSDKMSYFDRLKNFISAWSFYAFYSRVASQEQILFRQKYGDDFINLDDKLAQASFAFVNVDPLLDFPSMVSQKVVYINGIGVHKPKPLDKFWADVMTKRKDVVLISFGMYVQGYTMPEEMKRALLEAFKKFPDVTFIWKYEKKEHEIAKGLENVLTFEMVPQSDLLAHDNLRAFVTHAGMNSITEASHRGVPVITIPLLGDQMRNAKMVERMGTAIRLDKSDLKSSDKIEAAFRAILTNPSYAREAKRVAEMIVNRPVPVETLLVKHVEFAATFGQLPNLDPAGRKQSFFVYHSLDVWATLVTVPLVSLYVICKIVKGVAKTCLKGKAKME